MGENRHIIQLHSDDAVPARHKVTRLTRILHFLNNAVDLQFHGFNTFESFVINNFHRDGMALMMRRLQICFGPCFCLGMNFLMICHCLSVKFVRSLILTPMLRLS